MIERLDSEFGREGDWVEAHGVAGGPPRKGRIVKVLGAGAHTRYRVRWDEMHESIVYPADGVRIVRARDAAHAVSGSSR